MYKFQLKFFVFYIPCLFNGVINLLKHLVHNNGFFYKFVLNSGSSLITLLCVQLLTLVFVVCSGLMTLVNAVQTVMIVTLIPWRVEVLRCGLSHFLINGQLGGLQHLLRCAV